jgi:hypothetical protein
VRVGATSKETMTGSKGQGAKLTREWACAGLFWLSLFEVPKDVVLVEEGLLGPSGGSVLCAPTTAWTQRRACRC